MSSYQGSTAMLLRFGRNILGNILLFAGLLLPSIAIGAPAYAPIPGCNASWRADGSRLFVALGGLAKIRITFEGASSEVGLRLVGAFDTDVTHLLNLKQEQGRLIKGLRTGDLGTEERLEVEFYAAQTTEGTRWVAFLYQGETVTRVDNLGGQDSGYRSAARSPQQPACTQSSARAARKAVLSLDLPAVTEQLPTVVVRSNSEESVYERLGL